LAQSERKQRICNFSTFKCIERGAQNLQATVNTVQEAICIENKVT